jgi:hypothetical protein
MFHAGPITKKPAPSVNTRGATMKDLIIYLDCKFREYYIPGKNICTDESTIGFKGRVASDEDERLNRKPHLIYSNEKSNSKDCAVCRNRRIKGGRRETVSYCNTCTRKPGLHPGECFEKYHSLKKYK